MQIESDPDKLAALEDQLTLLTGKAQQTIGELEQKDKAAAEKVENQGDELDREIRRILSKFSASTYLVPPLFKERLKHHIQQTVSRSNTRTVYARKQKYWPMIIKEFSARGLPEEMAYVAWTESQFDPLADNPSGARGMWQFMAPTARSYGLRVDSSVDQRIDAQKETRAAAHYLANLLADFGEDSFMLAIASYNKGEAGMRRVLHEVAQEPGGFRKEKRDFWHLYRLKKLPQETLEYVPQILAAAVISNNPKKYGLE
jgi:membrane-bound lytic murein transglycosylase D